MKILVSHESPVSLFHESLVYNDYQYCLVHLMEKKKEYRNWFLEDFRRTKTGGTILLDNSAFELGRSFSFKRYWDWVDKIKPDYFIMPDVIGDYGMTIYNFNKFTKEYPKWDRQPTVPIGVVQGRTWRELASCYNFMKHHVEYIGITFNCEYYEFVGEGENVNERKMSGRQLLIKRLIDEGIWDWNISHHLLGCSLAKEFKWYVNNNIYNIKSLDTSNPIVAGFENLRYRDDFGLAEKPTGRIEDYLYKTPDKIQKGVIEYNIDQFRKIIGREPVYVK